MTIHLVVALGLVMILIGSSSSSGGRGSTVTVVALDFQQNQQDVQRQQQRRRQQQQMTTAEISSTDKYVQCENVPGVGGTTTVNPVVLEGKRFYDEATGEYFPVKGTCI